MPTTPWPQLIIKGSRLTARLGGDRCLVVLLVFKTSARHASVVGGFDSHSPPPFFEFTATNGDLLGDLFVQAVQARRRDGPCCWSCAAAALRSGILSRTAEVNTEESRGYATLVSADWDGSGGGK